MEIGAELFRRMIEASPDGLWILDEAGCTVYANQRMAELVGRAPAQMPGLFVGECLDEAGNADLPRHLHHLRTAPDDDEGQADAEVRLVRPDGTSVWVLAAVSPLRGDDGRRVGWVHRITDNTGQKQLLDALRQREQLLAEAQQIARIGSWDWDVVTDTVTWSDQLHRIYDVTPEQFTRTYAGFLGFVHPDDRSRVEAAVASIFAGDDEFAWEARIHPLGGGERWVRSLGRVERGPDGRPVRMSGTAQDITERVTADQLAAEATRRLFLLQTMATAANQTNSLHEALELAAVGLPELTSWEAIGAYHTQPDGTEAFLDLTHHTVVDKPAPDPALAAACREAKAVRHAPAPGREDTHSIVSFPVLVDGAPSWVVQVVADEVPPDENSMALIEQISSQMEQVAHRERAAAQLAEARDEAMEASRLKSEFLATMSHEIRTPMNGVIGLTDLLRRTDLDSHQRRLADGLQSAGLTLLGIINDVLDLSKIEAGKLELEEVDFDVREVLDTSTDVPRRQAEEKGIALVVSCHPEVPAQLRGDPVRLGQVVANLASNAVKFTAVGEVSVHAEVASSTRERVVLRVAVSDTGVGIDPGLRPRLFDAFTQADPSTTREHGGTGLGLAISEQLVNALGGRIEVDSQPGVGSTFTFTADLGRGQDAPCRSLPADPSVLAGRRVLVVEGDEPTRLGLCAHLAAWGTTPVVVETSEAAMAAVRTAVAAGEPFEVALLDSALPDGDGLALARAIGAGSRHRPQMLLLHCGPRVDLAAARAAGFRDVLTTPVREPQLLQAMAAAVAPPEQPVVTAPPRERHPISGRVLVVEDNQVNQMVAVGLLESGGFSVDVATDGEEAVAALAPGHPYIAVLMDCRMPRLDGFDATRAIRAREPAGQRVPIIAMTASALEGEEQRCLDAGMDDFLTKPVDPARMMRALHRWASGAATPQAPEEAGVDDPLDPTVVDLDRMRMLDELVRDGVSLFERAASTFGARAGAARDEVQAAAESGDAEALFATAHRLKGSATNLGLVGLGEAAGALEEAGRAGDLSDVPALLAVLDEALDTALAALDEVARRGL